MIDWRDRISLAGMVIVYTLVVLFFGLACFAVFFIEIPEGSRAVAYTLLGILGARFGDVVTYFTGSTSSSQKKDQTIAEANRAIAAKVP